MTSGFSPDVGRPLAMLAACPAYQPSPLTEIPPLGSRRVLIKDETGRMGLGAFKALGGVYAVARALLQRWQEETGADLAPVRLTDPAIRDWSHQFTFVCASAGNHGMAVARGAQLFGAGCRVHLASTVPEEFADRLEALDATVLHSGTTYEESMVSALQDAAAAHRILLADSSWPGYEEIPAWVMEGYTVMGQEILDSLSSHQTWPTHVFLQAGVGGLAAALTHHIRQHWESQPRIIIVEPDAAPCLAASRQAGHLTTVAGPVSAMGRLDCKTPSVLALATLQEGADDFVSISDDQAVTGQACLQRCGIATTPSGAAGAAALLAHEPLGLNLPDQAICLVIVSEAAL